MRVGLVPALLLLAGCGSRSSPFFAHGTADGGLLGETALRPPREFGARDLSPVRDRICLPVPEGQVSGKYQATWNGSWTCPGSPAIGMAGHIIFELTPGAGAGALTMKGTMFGAAPFPVFSGTVSGSMSCTLLTATVPNIDLGGGVAASGSLSGELAWISPTAGWGFPKGTWKATQTGGGCTASGTWGATKQ